MDPLESSECTDWRVMVRCYDAQNNNGYDTLSKTIPEKVFCVAMPNLTSGPLGRPVDANLAVNLISNFFSVVTDAYGPPNDEDVLNLSYDDLLKYYMQARVFLKELQDIDYGMSIDKAFALKLLSQPKCEGLRGYLCYKPGNIDGPVSLVTVGIDECGYDLRYNNSNTVVYGAAPDQATVLPAINAAPPVANVTMQSLNGEYVTPPYTFINLDLKAGTSETPDSVDDGSDRFVLLNIAKGNSELLKF